MVEQLLAAGAKKEAQDNVRGQGGGGMRVGRDRIEGHHAPLRASFVWVL